MDRERDVIYWYDGSFEGFLCCVFQSYARHEIPFDIWRPETRQTSMFPTVAIETDPAQSQRVYASIQNKLGAGVHRMTMLGFLNGDEGKEIKLLRFLRFCYTKGPGAAYMLGEAAVAEAAALERDVNVEAERFLQFIRFEDRDGMLGAVISPRHYVLPVLRGHFCSRYPDEDFIIYDNCHYVALLYKEGAVSYVNFEKGYLLNTPEQAEAAYQRMWKAFYKAVEIKQRENLALRRSHCPKRFWENMVELRDEA